MNNDIWILVDVQNLCHRAWHAMKGLSYHGQGTGVLYGVLRDIRYLQDMHDTANIAFCFDQGDSLRKTIYPDYKANRDRTGKESLYAQIQLLHHDILPKIGFYNIFSAEGYEADDWIGYICKNELKNKQAVIVSSDQDLYQLLLNDLVSMWKPTTKETYTADRFYEEWGVTPQEWVDVMAITGCSTDNIRGVSGVAEIKAIKYLKHQMSSTKTYSAIRVFETSEQHTLNRKLVTVPWPGLDDKFGAFVDDNVTPKKWREVLQKYGMNSLESKCPVTH